jgi:lipid A 3-O-deacylase
MLEANVSDIAFVTDGTMAVVGLIAGLIDMSVNHCPNDGCLAKNDVAAYNSLALGETYFQDNASGEEIYFRRDTGLAFGPFQNVWGLSATTDGEFWIGAGHAYTMHLFNERTFIQFHAMTGLYENGSGHDLGGPIEFRSGIELGYQARNGTRIGLGVDHRSNSGIYSRNPGLETVHLRVSIPIK